MLQALRLRLDPHWRRHVRWLLPWAIACFVAIWVLALWRELPRGLAQKAVIAMIVGWLACVAVLLGRISRPRKASSANLPHDPTAADSGGAKAASVTNHTL